MNGRPVVDAYADVIDHPCPNCKAASEAFCTFGDGTARSIPCVARFRAAAGQPEAKEVAS